MVYAGAFLAIIAVLVDAITIFKRPTQETIGGSVGILCVSFAISSYFYYIGSAFVLIAINLVLFLALAYACFSCTTEKDW